MGGVFDCMEAQWSTFGRKGCVHTVTGACSRPSRKRGCLLASYRS